MSMQPAQDPKELTPLVAKTLEAIPWADPEIAQMRMAEAILLADTVKDALTPPEEKIGLRLRWVNRNFTITSVCWMESSIEGNLLDRYAFVECVSPEGEPFVGTIGATNVCLQLARVAELGGFPVKVRLIETVSRSHPDRKPLWLKIAGSTDDDDF